MKQPEELNPEFDLHLAEALRSVAPPDGFADRVMARAHSPVPASAKVVRMPLGSRPWISGAIAAALLIGVYTGEQVHQRRQRERTERAQRQFDDAMRIIDQTLEHVRLQLQQAGIAVGN